MVELSRLRDSLLVCVQTLLSNGVGASVGLEAAYAQAGGGFASVIGQWLRLRRADMRISWAPEQALRSGLLSVLR